MQVGNLHTRETLHRASCATVQLLYRGMGMLHRSKKVCRAPGREPPLCIGFKRSRQMIGYHMAVGVTPYSERLIEWQRKVL